MIQLVNIKKKIFRKFLLKAVVLISFKEFYLFLRNLYGLVVHPFKTIVEIRKRPDWSQTILIFGLPVYGGIGGLMGLVVGLVILLFFQPTNEFLVNFFFLLFAVCCLLFAVCSLYLAFWVGKYLKIKTLA